MHWSRLIDAPLAGLVLIGNLFGAGEVFALTAWPLLLLLGLMAGAVSVGTALAGRGAALPVLILSLLFFDPLLSFLPNHIDHHNAQLVLLVAMLAVRAKASRAPVPRVACGTLRRAEPRHRTGNDPLCGRPRRRACPAMGTERRREPRHGALRLRICDRSCRAAPRVELAGCRLGLRFALMVLCDPGWPGGHGSRGSRTAFRAARRGCPAGWPCRARRRRLRRRAGDRSRLSCRSLWFHLAGVAGPLSRYGHRGVSGLSLLSARAGRDPCYARSAGRRPRRGVAAWPATGECRRVTSGCSVRR